MKKNQKNKFSPTTLLIITLLFLLCVGIYISSKEGKKESVQTLRPEETHAYVLSKAAKKMVSEKYTPVLLYTILSPTTVHFLGSGTLVDKQNRKILITADHIFSTNPLHGNTPIGIRVLQPMNEQITMFVSSVTEKTFTGRDIAIASTQEQKVKSLPPIIRRYSLETEIKTSVPVITTEAILPSGRRITKLQSLLTGEWYDIIGTILGEAVPGSAVPISLNYDACHGQSGEGFQDEEGSLYVVSTCELQVQPDWDKRKKEINTMYQRKVNGITTVYGPLKIN